MKRTWNRTAAVALYLIATAIAQTSCDIIDDDLSDCGRDLRIDYELRLVTNVGTEIENVLEAKGDMAAADALRRHLQNIFTDRAHDIDLSFYDTRGDSARLHHEQHIMDASQTSYTLYLPAHHYMHLAAANTQGNSQVTLAGDDRCHRSQLLLSALLPDTIQPHSTGLFTARRPIDVMATDDQTFHVGLYMANCATALVLDTAACPSLRGLRVYSTGFAIGFSLADTLYHFAPSAIADPVVFTDAVATTEGSEQVFCSVNFPSREQPLTRLVVETEEPFLAATAAEAIWGYYCYATLADGTTTLSVLSLRKPLRAGQLKIVRGILDDRGRVRPDDSTVGVSVSLDWKQGGDHDVPL